jgi:hypothetical protein
MPQKKFYNIGGQERILVTGGIDLKSMRMLSTVEAFDGQKWKSRPEMFLNKPGK